MNGVKVWKNISIDLVDFDNSGDDCEEDNELKETKKASDWNVFSFEQLVTANQILWNIHKMGNLPFTFAEIQSPPPKH